MNKIILFPPEFANRAFSRMARWQLLAGILTALLWPALSQAQTQTPAFSGPHSTWHEDFDRYDYILDEQTLAITPYTPPAGEGFGVKDPPAGFRRCIVVVPHRPAAGNPWSWRGCYWDHQPQTEIELLKRGFFIAYISANATLRPGAAWDAFYTWLTHQKGLSPKPAFIGMSRGGEYEYQWATTHPDAVSCIYADNPAVDRSSLELLGGLADHDVPLLHVCGSIDPLYAGSTAAVENIYQAFGGRISVMIKEGYGHHPHSLRDPKPIADFIEQSFQEKTTATPDFVKTVYAGPGASGSGTGAKNTRPGTTDSGTGATNTKPGTTGSGTGSTNTRPGETGSEPAAKTWYYSNKDSYRRVPAENAYISTRGPFFSGAYARFQLLIPGVDAFTTVIVPKRPAPGMPWVFRADYVKPDDGIDQALLAEGWTIVTGAVPYNYDGPVLAQWNAIYAYLTGYGFHKRPVLMGRGGAAGEAMAWAAANPEKVTCIYAENPIFESKLNRKELDSLAALAKSGVPLLFVCGDDDPSQQAQQTLQTQQAQAGAARYKTLGGKVTVIVRKGEGHFLRPEDAATVLHFIGQ